MSNVERIHQLVAALAQDPSVLLELIKIGSPAVGSLFNVLHDEDPILRSWAAWALGKIGDKSALEPLLKALYDPEPIVQGRAAEALVEIEAIEELLQLCSDENSTVRGLVIKALGKVRDERVIDSLVRALDDPSPSLRAVAAESLGQVGNFRAVEPLMRLLNDYDQYVQNMAAWALAEIGGKQSRETQNSKDHTWIEKETVSFTHYYPTISKSNNIIPLHVYIHSTQAINQVVADFETRIPFQGPASSVSEISALVFQRGTIFTIIPFVKHCRIVPALAEVSWEDDFEHVEFSIKPPNTSMEVIQGEVRIYVGTLIVGILRVSVILADEEAPTRGKGKFTRQTCEQYRKLFVSYSRDDLAVVQAVDRLYERHPEIETFIDYKFLKSGDPWSERIQRQIEIADALQLFWSPNSCKSTNVEKEWRYALGLPKPILPLIFGRPRPAIPKELEDIHFEDFDRFVTRL